MTEAARSALRAGPGGTARAALLAGALFGCCLSGCFSDTPPLTDAQQAALARYVVGSLPDSATKADVDFDGKARLVGYQIEPKRGTYPPGTDVKVTLFWRCDQKLGDGHLLFAHLVGQGGQKLETIDENGPLRRLEGFVGQPLPPSRWEVGKIYRDELSFQVPADPTPQVTVAAGIYKGDQRLAIRGAGGDKESRTTIVRLATGAKDARAVIKELEVQKLSPGITIRIDGLLDEPSWAAAPKAGPFVDVGAGRENPALPTQGNARLLWDSTFLYVGFEVLDKKVRGGWPEDAKDPHLWEKDTVEVMVDPDGDGDNKDYYEIQINPQNLVFDTQYDGYNSPNGGGKGPFGHEEWSAGLVSAVKVHGTIDDDGDDDQGYTVEAKIPWASFGKAKQSPPRDGQSWRMNFYAMQNNGGTAWSPILGQGNFHRASRFGRVQWVDRSGPPASASASASAVAPP